MDLREYDGKIVRIKNRHGQTFLGFADYHYADDNASGIESLTLEMGVDGNTVMHEFIASEIVGITIISSDAFEMPLAQAV